MKRDKWTSRSTFILAAIGSAVGLGNAWRFPGQAAKYGGGTFLVAYIIAIVIAGIPLLMSELTIGRKMQKGAPGTFRGMNKKLEWVGWASVATAFVISCYYAAVLAWVMVMVVKSFTIPSSSNPEDIFMNEVLQASSGPLNLGGMSWVVFAALILAWIIIFLCIRDGAKTVGKVAKYTVFLPFLFLIVLAINGLTLDGASIGLKEYLIPKWSQFLNIDVWIAAFGQVFYSMSIMMAIMITYGSFLKKNSNIKQDTIVIASADLIISFLSGLVIFSTLGYISAVEGKPLEINSGVTLAFIVYPMVIAALPGGAIVQVIVGMLFYLTLFTLAVGSAFSIVEAVSTAISDKFHLKKKKTTICVCIVTCVISVLFATKAGLYWLDIVDAWANSFDLMLVGVLECLAIGWFFGTKRVKKEFDKDSLHKTGKWYEIVIKFICPALFIIMIIRFIVDIINNGYGGYPTLALMLGGWIISLLVFLVGFIIMFISKRSKRIIEIEKNEKTWDEIDREEEIERERYEAARQIEKNQEQIEKN